ncbi:MAG: SAM-dependent methyltransferase, partial [Candidatus Rokuibacteriota bacterium]
MSVLDFYDRHPISEPQVLAAVARRRSGLTAPLCADDLFDFDQDHYGGLAAVDALARKAGIEATSRVLDVCAGLGGPARFLASRRGCQVVALELNPGRAAGARRLTR